MKTVLQEYLDALALAGPIERVKILHQAEKDKNLSLEEFMVILDIVYPF